MRLCVRSLMRSAVGIPVLQGREDVKDHSIHRSNATNLAHWMLRGMQRSIAVAQAHAAASAAPGEAPIRRRATL